MKQLCDDSNKRFTEHEIRVKKTASDKNVDHTSRLIQHRSK